MIPKEKAEELINKFIGLNSKKMSDDSRIEFPTAKKCALIAVDEFLYLQPFTTSKDLIDGGISDYIIRISNYWQEVKQEIEKL